VANLEPDALHQHRSNANPAFHPGPVNPSVLETADRHPGRNALHLHQPLPDRQTPVRQEEDATSLFSRLSGDECAVVLWHFVGG
jgi:hypothetical protein